MVLKMLTIIRNCQILKPIARILPKLHPNEVLAEVVLYLIKTQLEVTDTNFRPIHEDLKFKFKIFNMGVDFK